MLCLLVLLSIGVFSCTIPCLFRKQRRNRRISETAGGTEGYNMGECKASESMNGETSGRETSRKSRENGEHSRGRIFEERKCHKNK